MRAAAREGRQDHLGGVGPRLALGFLVVHQRPVIGVAEADVALAGRDVARHFAVAAGRLLREVRLEAFQPFLGLRFAVLGEIRGEQRVVVHVLAGADADLALPLRVGEFLVGDRVLLHALLRGVDDARAHRDAVPGAVRAVIGLRHRLLEHCGLDRLRDAGVDRVLQPRDVDGEQHVGRRVRAFGLDALLEPGACRDHVDLDAGVLGEGFEQRLDQFLLAIRIDVDLALRGREAGSEGGGAERGEGERMGHGASMRSRRRNPSP